MSTLRRYYAECDGVQPHPIYEQLEAKGTCEPRGHRHDQGDHDRGKASGEPPMMDSDDGR